MNKTINQLPNAAVVATDEYEKQVTGGGASQKNTATQLLTFIQNNATAFAQKFDCALGLTVKAGTIVLNDNGSADFSNSVVTISSTGDIEITDTTKGLILWSPGGIRYRLKVDDAGNLGTVPA